MAEPGALLVHGVLRALVDADAVAARARSPCSTTRSTRLYHADLRRGHRAHARATQPTSSAGTRIIIASHYLERIGDRATNIAEDVVYLVTGDVEDLNP